jgi:hypothetical protein
MLHPNVTEREPTQAESQNDASLLKSLAPPITSELHAQLLAKVPKLAALAAARVNAQDKEPFTLYTEDTCMEFHQLLILLLESFRDALQLLSNSRGQAEEAPEEFKKQLRHVLFYGYVLQRMSKGFAIERHLTTIQDLLDDHRRMDARMGEEQEVDHGLMDASMEEEEEEDAELLEVQPTAVWNKGQRQPLWKSYRNWLRLILVHINSVEILVSYVTSNWFRYQAISIKILVSPARGGFMLPLQKLLQSQWFPLWSGHGGISPVTNDDIISFLAQLRPPIPANAVDAINVLMRTLKKFTNIEAPVTKTTKKEAALSEAAAAKRDSGLAKRDAAWLQTAKEEAAKLAKYNFPGWTKYTGEIMADISKFEGLKPSERQSSINNIIPVLDLLLDNARVWQRSEKFKSGRDFTGALHCEACLVGLLTLSPGDCGGVYDSLLPQLVVICVVFIITFIS